MKQFSAFAPDLRVDALLCCSTPVLPSACGGSGRGAGATPATTHHHDVSPPGPDTASGARAAPLKTLARAARAATRTSTTVAAPAAAGGDS